MEEGCIISIKTESLCILLITVIVDVVISHEEGCVTIVYLDERFVHVEEYLVVRQVEKVALG